MKKFLTVAMMFLTLGIAYADNGESMTTLHGFYIAPELDAFIPTNDDIDTTVFVGGKVGYQWNEWVALEIEPGWANSDFSGDIGDVTTIPLLFNARLTPWPGVYMVDPYLFGGVGVGFNSIDLAIPGVEIDNSFALQIGGGAEYHINESLSAFLDLRWMFNEPDVNIELNGEDSVDLSAFVIGGGVIWRF